MKIVWKITAWLLLLCSQAPVAQADETPSTQFPHPERIRYDGSCLTIEGKDTFIYSAAFHYFRCPEPLWRERFRKIKEAGFNTVETYVPWNWHERVMPLNPDEPGEFDFADLRRWLKMAQEEFDFYTIVRPGPFICAEFSGGGYPRWLAKYRPESYNGFWLRSADEQHIRWCEHWYNAICKELRDEQITCKKPGEKGIILFQIENEYNHHDCANKEDLLKALLRCVRKNQIDIPVFTCLTKECRNSPDPELSQVFDSDNYYVGLRSAPDCAFRMESLRQAQPQAPGFVTELQGGWFSLVTGRLSDEHYSDARHFRAIGLMSMLGGATGLNYYMFFGGTNFAGWGARGMTTTYDYNAAIRENGGTGPKYAEAKAIGDFIRTYGSQLVRAEGGPCLLDGAPKDLFGGIRIAPDGTRFIFLHNTHPQQALKGEVKVVPGMPSAHSEPMYNINQHGEKVLVSTTQGTEQENGLSTTPLTLSYELPALGSQVYVLPAGASVGEGEWWPKTPLQLLRPANLPLPVRISSALKKEDPTSAADWKLLPQLVSLSDLGVQDFRYSLYRAHVRLTARQAADEHFLLFNLFTRDIVSVTVNGHPAVRLYPDNADAQSWPTRGCFERIRPDEYDNRFEVSGLLREGNNEIQVVYENLGHAHGYFPMEELAGIRQAGLSITESALTHPLTWECATDVAGVTLGWQRPEYVPKGWEKVELDTTSEIPAQGSVQSKSEPDGLFTWYRIEFELPAQDPEVWIPWLARMQASGNGYMWLNGHNIGRHWEASRQRKYFLPECWLHFGRQKNVLVIGLRQTGKGALLKALEIAPYSQAAEFRK